MTTLEGFLVSLPLGLGLGLPLYLPWLLARLGYYKRWYIVHFTPPFSWSRAVYVWPASLMFVSMPCVALLPVDSRENAWHIISFSGFILAIIMVIRPPGWAKPKWQRYLEANYSQAQIQRCIPLWREMERRQWSQLLDSEAGIDELVSMGMPSSQGRKSDSGR